jgi:hypothetical protein
MADSWLDDINDEVVLNVQTKEQLKRIEERKLMEESELQLTKLLFEDKPKIEKKELDKGEKKELDKREKKELDKREKTNT